MIFQLQGSKKCTFNHGFVKMAVKKDRLEDAFSAFRHDFPSAGDPQCVGEFPDWKTYDTWKQQKQVERYSAPFRNPTTARAAA